MDFRTFTKVERILAGVALGAVFSLLLILPSMMNDALDAMIVDGGIGGTVVYLWMSLNSSLRLRDEYLAAAERDRKVAISLLGGKLHAAYQFDVLSRRGDFGAELRDAHALNREGLVSEFVTAATDLKLTAAEFLQIVRDSHAVDATRVFRAYALRMTAANTWPIQCPWKEDMLAALAGLPPTNPAAD